MSWLDHSEQSGWPYDGRWLANSPQPAPDGYLFESYPGRGENYVGTTAMAASGTIQETGIFLPAGVTVSKLAYMNGTTAPTSQTHRWMQLKMTEGRLLCVTQDAGSTAATASALNSQLTAQIASAMTNSGTTVTAAVATTVGLSVGESIAVSGAAGLTNVNGTWAIASIVDATHFTFVVATTPTGTYTASSASITLSAVTPYSGLYYLGLLVVASVMPTLVGFSSISQLNGLPPILCGTGATGQTNPPAPNAIQALTTAGANFFYGCVG